jgi:predicted nucleic acid-binding protein
MIIIDTNVISELWKADPNPNVLAWVDNQMIETLYLSAITVAELRFGLAAMPAGKRRKIFQERLENEVLPRLHQSCAAF